MIDEGLKSWDVPLDIPIIVSLQIGSRMLKLEELRQKRCFFCVFQIPGKLHSISMGTNFVINPLPPLSSYSK